MLCRWQSQANAEEWETSDYLMYRNAWSASQIVDSIAYRKPGQMVVYYNTSLLERIKYRQFAHIFCRPAAYHIRIERRDEVPYLLAAFVQSWQLLSYNFFLNLQPLLFLRGLIFKMWGRSIIGWYVAERMHSRSRINFYFFYISKTTCASINGCVLRMFVLKNKCRI